MRSAFHQTGLRWIAFAWAAATGCSSVPRDAGYEVVDQSIHERVGSAVSSSAPDTSGLAAMLSSPLTVEKAVQVALANNRELQAAFEEVGVARGDWVAVGLWPNPTFDGSVRWRDETSTTNPELALTWDIMEVIRRSKRSNVAHAELDRVAFEVSDRAVAFASDVRTAFFDLQAAQQVSRMQTEVHRAAKASSELAQRRRTAGNINELENAVEQSVYQDARLDLMRAQASAKVARAALGRLMGLTPSDSAWTVVAELPEIPAADPAIDTLETLAVANRLDLRAARKEVEAGAHDVSYRKSYRLPSLEVGVDAERDFDEPWAYGPVVQMAIPLFDRGQGGIDRAHARLRQAEHAAAAAETNARNDVRAAWDGMRAARDVVETYRDDVIPTREKVVAESQRHYNFMLVGPMVLLQAKRDEIDAYRGYIEAVRDYWIARARMERAVATRIEELE